MVTALAALAAVASALVPTGPQLKVSRGHAVTARVYAARRGELLARASGARCTLQVTVDHRATVTLRPKRKRAVSPISSVSRGWHSVSVRTSWCRGVVAIHWLVRIRKRVSSGPPASHPGAPANPFAGKRFYVDPNSDAARSESSYLAQGDTADASLMAKIAGNPHADWFGGWDGPDPSAAVSSAVAQADSAGALPVLVAYNIPDLGCGGPSAGAATPADYEAWIDGLARGIGNAQAVVILEPDAIPELDCMSAAQQQTTLSLLSYAVQTLSAGSGTSVYIDAGNSGWQPASVIAARLRAADVAQATGFSLNVSNFLPTATEESYGDGVSALVGGKHFVVDTSRNGQGSDGQWCNPPGRGLGQPATTGTGDRLADAVFWIKPPGESDGTCNGGPSGGAWWPAYALGLAANASF